MRTYRIEAEGYKGVNLIGEKFGKWTVVSKSHTRHTPNGTVRRLWICECECGVKKSIASHILTRGESKSCGCDTSNLLQKHGGHGHPNYNSWRGMIDRCDNPLSKDFCNYGLRGIDICDTWRRDFWSFVSDMGERPMGLTIERINNNGNYEPGNCRWATRGDQASNRRSSRIITAMGETLSLTQWASKCGVWESGLRYRLDVLGQSPEEAVRSAIQMKATLITKGRPRI